jgi:hypothetical protein
MPPRPGPASQEGYPSDSPSADAHSNEPFQRRYYDNDSDHVEYGRRDYRETYASDTSNPPGNDYDPANYDYRGSHFDLFVFCLITLQHYKIPTPIPMYMDSAPCPPLSL